MITTVQNKTVNFLSNLVDKIEQYDADIKNRERVFREKELKEEGLKEVSADLLDIGLHQGMKGVQVVKKQPIYKLTDQYVHFDEKAETLKNTTIDLANFVNDKVYFPMREKIVFIYDEATKVLSFLVQIYNEH